MKKWRIGIVGTGLIADFHARAIADLENAELTGCSDTIAAKSETFAAKFNCRVFKDHEEMANSNDIDILSIATPSGAHAEPVIAAARARKHVICEKPLDVTLERIDAMIEAHRQAGTILGGIFPYRFTDSMAVLRKAIEDARFGTVTFAGISVPWWRTDEYYKDSWHGTWNLDGGGALMNQSIHMIDMLCDLMLPVVSVQAFMAKKGHPQIEAEDTAVVALRYADGALGTIYGSSASYPGRFRQFEMTGTKGTVVMVEDSFTVWQFAEETDQDQKIRSRFGQVQGLGSVADPAKIGHENHRRNFAAFLQALDSGNKFAIDGNEGRKAVRLILAIYKSAREGKMVVPDEL